MAGGINMAAYQRQQHGARSWHQRNNASAALISWRRRLPFSRLPTYQWRRRRAHQRNKRIKAA